MLTGLSTVNEEDPDGHHDPTGFAIHVTDCHSFNRYPWIYQLVYMPDFL